MSIETWKKEFYPVEAAEIADTDATVVELIAHSLKKWEGVRPGNIKKHGLKRAGYDSFHDGEEYFELDGDSCSLCAAFYGKQDISDETDRCEDSDCSVCPIFLANGKTCADAYQEFTIGSRRPTKMVNLLRKTLKHYEAL